MAIKNGFISSHNDLVTTFYVVGVKGHGQEVIKTLEKLGGTRPNDKEISGENENYIYYINSKGIIDSTPIFSLKGMMVKATGGRMHHKFGEENATETDDKK